MSAKRRKYKFNVLDYLWYMGKDSQRISQYPTPYKAVVYGIVLWASFFAGVFIASFFKAYSAVIIVACLIIGFLAYLRYEVYLDKYHFTKEREQEYFLSYPERRHYSSWLLFVIPIIVLVLYFVIFGMALVAFAQYLK